MEFTVEKLNAQTILIDEKTKKVTMLEGYALMDKTGHCIICVYGEGRRDSMIKYFKGDTDELHLKYDVIPIR